MTRPRRLLAAVSTAHALDHVYLLALPPLLAPLMDEFGTGLLGSGAALTWLLNCSSRFLRRHSELGSLCPQSTTRPNWKCRLAPRPERS